MVDKDMDAFRKLINEAVLTREEAASWLEDQSSISVREVRENYETNVEERLAALVRKSEEVAELAKDLDQIINAKVERGLQKDAPKD